ncbi:N-glycosyltransferase [Escherichia coli]|nr:N-glycosyltransferase [Escherichia coli]CAD5794381.1 N-glycosyltransferase [Escherichia coli]
MSVFWVTGGLYFWFQLERHWSWNAQTHAPVLAGNPLISILIPCFNEERSARETISAALAQEQPRLRIIHLAENQGKAVALQRREAIFWSVSTVMPCSTEMRRPIW